MLLRNQHFLTEKLNVFRRVFVSSTEREREEGEISKQPDFSWDWFSFLPLSLSSCAHLKTC